MRKEIKEDILNAAKTLFISRGYHGVSLKDIADAVGISKGNLTYHFSKKEAIMEALLSQHEDRKRLPVPTTLQELDDVFLDKQQAVQNNAYYFLHHAEFSQLSPKIAAMQNVVYEENMELFRKAFINLRDAGLIREELFSGEYDALIDTLHMTCIYWQPYSMLFRKKDGSVEYRQQAWNIMYGILSEKGRQLVTEN